MRGRLAVAAQMVVVQVVVARLVVVQVVARSSRPVVAGRVVVLGLVSSSKSEGGWWMLVWWLSVGCAWSGWLRGSPSERGWSRRCMRRIRVTLQRSGLRRLRNVAVRLSLCMPWVQPGTRVRVMDDCWARGVGLLRIPHSLSPLGCADSYADGGTGGALDFVVALSRSLVRRSLLCAWCGAYPSNNGRAVPGYEHPAEHPRESTAMRNLL